MNLFPGLKHGKLTIMSQAETRKYRTYWLCKCDCGNEKIIPSKTLKRKNSTQSCGCLIIKGISQRATTHGHTKNRGYSLLYAVWQGMKSRCNYKKHVMYKYYGGRGIKICEEWVEFTPFLNWAIETGYKYGLTLDRIDNDKGYNRDNCRWVSRQVNANNTRKSIYIEIDGKRDTISNFSREFSIRYGKLYERIFKLNWTPKDAVSK